MKLLNISIDGEIICFKNPNATQEVYKALAQLYREHPEFRQGLDSVHPELAVFMAEAMKVFADRKLS